jgi:serine/threonine-protein kinase
MEGNFEDNETVGGRGMEGYLFGSYRVIRALGEGGMGAVYEVVHEKLGVHYALKTFILSDGYADLFRKRFQAEGKILARLNFPGIVRVFDLDIDPQTGILYYVMDLILYKDGEAYTLADLEPGGADEDHLVQWFSELCRALAYIHSQGVVHRDIKLNNILLAPERHVYLSDFGISKIRDEKLRTDVDVTRTFVTGAATGEKIVMGTAGYMAPEVLRGEEVTPAADIYSLGVVFFKLLTGVWYEPHMADGNKTAIRLLDHFDRPWAKILPMMLDADPTRRPTDLVALADTLVGTAVQQASPVSRPKRIRWVVAAVASAVIAAAAYFAFRYSSDVRFAEFEEADAFNIPESLK